MPAELHVCGPRDKPRLGAFLFTIVNTTSRSNDPWSTGLSPFFLGPVSLYSGMNSQNVENAWQYAKVYDQIDGVSMVDANGNPNEAYLEWALTGWQKARANRYPAGKGRRPLYIFWNFEKLNYVEARKQVYVPLYAEAVIQTEAFQQLQKMYQTMDSRQRLYLWDFDGYDHKAQGMSYEQVLNDPIRKMGHAFVLAMLLENRQVLLNNLR